MLMATAFHVRKREYQSLPLTLGLCLAAAFVAYGRWPLLGQA
jgi:hypothetical protein